MLVGYLRTGGDDTDNVFFLQQLKSATCERIVQDNNTGRECFGLLSVLDSMNAGDVLVVTRLDELARSIRELNMICEIFASRALYFWSLKENIISSSESGKQFLRHLTIVAEFDRSAGKIRGQAANCLARARGKSSGRPPSLDERQIAAARELRRQAMPIKEISQKLGVSKSTLYRHLQKDELSVVVS